MSDRRILVINPNSNDAVTRGFSEHLRQLRVAGGPRIDCITLPQGPFGIESQADVEQVTLPLIEIVSSDTDSDAFVIACYSDPGLHVCREATAKPVFGIQESGILTALALGDRFGVVALKPASVRRHMRYLRQMGVTGRLAGERALDLSVEESESPQAFERLAEVAIQLRDADGADVIVLGCAGMARHRFKLQSTLGLNVVDPVQAAAGQAVAAVLLMPPEPLEPLYTTQTVAGV